MSFYFYDDMSFHITDRNIAKIEPVIPGQDFLLTLGCLVLAMALFGCTSTMPHRERRMLPPEAWKIIHASDECINVSGEYSMRGIPAAESYATFRGAPYTLDVMLGQDIPRPSRDKIKTVRLEQKINTIKLIYFIDDAIAFEKTISPPSQIVICQGDRVAIVKKSVKTFGEATTGLADIYETLFIGADGSLIVNTTIEGISTGLISFSYQEEYCARFENKIKIGEH